MNLFWDSDFTQTRNKLVLYKPWTNFQIFIISQHQCFKQSVKIHVHENTTSYIFSTHWGSQGPSGEFKRQSSLKPFFSSHTIPRGGTRPNGKLKLCEYKKKYIWDIAHSKKPDLPAPHRAHCTNIRSINISSGENILVGSLHYISSIFIFRSNASRLCYVYHLTLFPLRLCYVIWVQESCSKNKSSDIKKHGLQTCNVIMS